MFMRVWEPDKLYSSALIPSWLSLDNHLTNLRDGKMKLLLLVESPAAFDLVAQPIKYRSLDTCPDRKLEA
jgi:hypothetical protein